MQDGWVYQLVVIWGPFDRHGLRLLFLLLGSACLPANRGSVHLLDDGRTAMH